MFDIGLQELVLIFVVALLVFGPKNLPQLGRSLGRAMREFRKASDEFRSTIETNLQINEPDPPPSYPSTASTFETVSAEPAAVVATESLEPVGASAGAGATGAARRPSPRRASRTSLSAAPGSFTVEPAAGSGGYRRRIACTSSGSPTLGTRGFLRAHLASPGSRPDIFFVLDTQRMMTSNMLSRTVRRPAVAPSTARARAHGGGAE